MHCSFEQSSIKHYNMCEMYSNEFNSNKFDVIYLHRYSFKKPKTKTEDEFPYLCTESIHCQTMGRRQKWSDGYCSLAKVHTVGTVLRVRTSVKGRLRCLHIAQLLSAFCRVKLATVAAQMVTLLRVIDLSNQSVTSTLLPLEEIRQSWVVLVFDGFKYSIK